MATSSVAEPPATAEAAAQPPQQQRRVLLSLLACLSCRAGLPEDEGHPGCASAAADAGAEVTAQWAKKAAAAGGGSGSCAGAAGRGSASADGASSSACSMIPALYELPKRPSGTGTTTGDVLSCDAPSTSYPATTSIEEEWDVLGACMTTAQEMEACVDAVLDGSIKSAQTLFARYDMDLDQRLRQQDLYDLCLELALALPYQEYQRFVEACFVYADSDGDGCITLLDFVPLYKSVAAVRRAFKRQDHHNNGQIDRFDFQQLLVDLAGCEEAQIEQQQPQQLQALADAAFSLADTRGRAVVNFGQTLVWYSSHLLARAKHKRASCSQLLEQP